MEMGNHKFMLGHSGFLSGPTGPATALGSSATGGITPPEGGVAPWMKSDNYSAWGLFSEWNPGNWQFEGGVFEAHHRAVRNATAVNNMITNAGLLPDQLARYQAAPGGNVVYNIKTYYLRAGYSIFTKAGEFVPYAFWDAYKNPEIIGLKAFGGDDEAGNFDGGKFTKDTVGLAYRPNPNVAIKVDHSFHFFKLLGRKTDRLVLFLRRLGGEDRHHESQANGTRRLGARGRRWNRGALLGRGPGFRRQFRSVHRNQQRPGERRVLGPSPLLAQDRKAGEIVPARGPVAAQRRPVARFPHDLPATLRSLLEKPNAGRTKLRDGKFEGPGRGDRLHLPQPRFHRFYVGSRGRTRRQSAHSENPHRAVKTSSPSGRLSTGWGLRSHPFFIVPPDLSSVI
jgi:hypothetical protein